MTTSTAKITKQDVKSTARQAQYQAKRAASNALFEALERYGYFARGVLYFIIGILAIQVAVGAASAKPDQTGAIEMIGAQPMGHLLLTLMAVGLFGYSIWGFVRAFLDPLHRGHDLKGIVERIGFLISAVSYGLLMLPVVQYVLNKPGAKSTGNPAGISAMLFGQPNGRYLVIAFGLFWLAAGLGQLYVAYKADFVKDFNTNRMSPEEFRWARRIGRFGYAARGIVFGIIGWFVIESGLTMNPQKAVGFDGALLKLAQAPSGTVILGIVALGLVAFGIFSAMCAKWNKVGVRQGASHG